MNFLDNNSYKKLPNNFTEQAGNLSMMCSYKSEKMRYDTDGEMLYVTAGGNLNRFCSNTQNKIVKVSKKKNTNNWRLKAIEDDITYIINFDKTSSVINSGMSADRGRCEKIK